MLGEPERIPHQPPDPVSVDCTTHPLLGDHKTQTGVTTAIGASQQDKAGVTGLARRVIEYGFEFRRRQQALVGRESITRWQSQTDRRARPLARRRARILRPFLVAMRARKP